MSLSTTTTATYTLLKYSRAYPSTTASEPPKEPDWQHFLNPVIRLSLDTKKSTSGNLKSLRLRILWYINSGGDLMDVDQPEVVFEDLDLLSFSTLPALDSHGLHTIAQGLPLKAVYRASVVGVRYMHPREVIPGALPKYRRFQMNFQSDSAAQAFIDAISHVCPCKANPVTGTNNLKTAMTHMPGNETSAILEKATAVTAVPLTHSGGIKRTSTRTPAPNSVNRIENTAPIIQSTHHLDSRDHPSHSISERIPLQDVSVAELTRTDARQNSSAGTGYSRCSSVIPTEDYPISACNTSFLGGGLSANIVDNSVPSVAVAHKFLGGSLPSSSAPDPSQASSFHNFNPLLRPSPAVFDASLLPQTLHANPLAAPARSRQAILLATAHETCALYNLPREELEALVAQVIREDGFPKLLETLDDMWRIKGLCGR